MHIFLISLLYNFLLAIFSLFYLPFLFFKSLKRGSNYFLNRFGIGIKVKEKGALWFHAVSLGETKALSSVIPLMQEKYPGLPLMISSTTVTGHNAAKGLFPNATHFYLPLDFVWIIQPIVRKISPTFLIFSETDLWFQLLKSAKAVEAKTAVISAKLSAKSASNYAKVSFFGKALFSYLDLVCAQNSAYKERFTEAGCPESKIVITGNLKYDITYQDYDGSFLQELRFPQKRPVVVIGSTHDPEEKLLLSALDLSKVNVLLVPRHPERFTAVADELSTLGLKFRRLNQEGQASIILVDQMGLLCKCYSIADVAIVAGSFTEKIGGHNILEPCYYDVPVLFGPYMFTQFQLVDEVLKAGVGYQVTLENLWQTLQSAIKNQSEERKGRDFIERLQGSSKKTVEFLANIL